MHRLLTLLVALLLLLFAAPAFAQTDPDEPVANDDPDVEQVDPGDEDVDDYTDGCNPGGAEGDYTYCGCRDVGPDGDYLYCPSADGGGGGEERGHGGGEGEPEILPEVVQTLPATSLPLTGYDPVPIAVLGLGLIMIGAGGRLRLARRS